MRTITLILSASLALSLLGCEGQRGIVKRLEGLKPARPPHVRRENAYWFLTHAHKLSADQKDLIAPLFDELLANDEDRLVRGYAATTLGRLRNLKNIPALLKALGEDKDKLVRCDVIRAIVAYKDPSLLHELTKASQTDRDADVRQAALVASVDLVGKEAIPSLIDALSDRDTNVVFTASGHLTQLTGQTLGLSQAAWRDWWRGHGEAAPAAAPTAKEAAPEEKTGESEKDGEKKKKKRFLFF